jgi:[ribosomal protein S18]-alanine N-acetyltransferase
VKIRVATSADIPFMMDLERSSPPAAHWTEQRYHDFLASKSGPRRLLLVAEQETENPLSQLASGVERPLAGFLVAQHVASEWELENIVVSATERQKGIGKRLLDALLASAREVNSAAVFLEVRESNRAARFLYEEVGFQQAGRRKNYYANPREDAILYRLTLR